MLASQKNSTVPSAPVVVGAKRSTFVSRRRPQIRQPVVCRTFETAERELNGHRGQLQNGHKSSQLDERDSTPDTTQGKFRWQDVWYPLAVVKDLPTDRPTPVRLLGNALVLWIDGAGKWRAFRDLCPHRLAPLSEGRVENGELMCSYHGWQFNGDGRATLIPQADDPKSHATAIASRRSCVASHPCEVEDGLVWVFGSCDAEAEGRSRGVERLVHPKLADGNHIQLTPWFMRDLPYGADVLCENVIDPAHVPFSHHGVQGDRFDVLKMLMKPAENVDPHKGFSVHSYAAPDVPESKRRMAYDLSFQPPSLIRYQYAQGSELVSHAVPTDPGRSRIFFTLVMPKAMASGAVGALLKLKTSKWLLWHDHMTRNNVLDGDNVFLALQDQELMRRQSKDWSKNYFMPASLDYGVKALRDWLSHKAEPVPWGPAALDPTRAVGQSREQMLNRMEQHTKHCPSCATAHKTFSLVRWAGGAAAIFTAVYAAFCLGSGAPLKQLLLPFAGTVIAALVGLKAADFKQKLEFQDYRHPEH